VRIDVVFDTVCPWCYVGKCRLEAALRARPHVNVQIGWWPFLLNPDMPYGGMERGAYLVRKFGSESRVRRIYGAIADAGQSVDIDFAFDRIRYTPNSVGAHRLVQFAARAGRGEAAVEALFFNYFINGRNIGETDTLLTIGSDLGLEGKALATYLDGYEDVAFVYEENARAHRLGINSVPSFIFNGSMVISGAHEVPVLSRMIDAASAPGVAAWPPGRDSVASSS
jgi:predicted DsbA family dithiol-disulfide isomerase